MRTFNKDKFRIAAFDLDGTVLLNGKIMPAVREALLALADSGVITVVSTGRCISMIPSDVPGCFKAGCYSNGGYCKASDGTVISTSPMDKSKVIDLFKKTREIGGDAFYFTPENRIVSENCYQIALNWAIKSKQTDFYNLISSVHDRWLRDIIDDTYQALLDETRPVIKVETNFPETAMKLKAAEYSSKVLGFETVVMDKMSLEITAGGVTKASGLKAVAEHYGSGLENVIAFGDSCNDVQMLESAGFSVAMANGDEAVKSCADIIAPSVKEDGIATVLKQLFNI